jgi:hypothetical protein
MPPLDQLPEDPPLKSPGAVYHKLRSLNAVRHGLTGQTVVMPWEDRQEYDRFCQAFLEDLKPVGFEQTQLAQTIVDCQWRLNRATAYESAIFYYEAYLAYQGLHEEEVEVEMCKARVAMTVEKHQLNITLYESRIQRKMLNARKSLKELQSSRDPFLSRDRRERQGLRSLLPCPAGRRPRGFRFFRSRNLLRAAPVHPSLRRANPLPNLSTTPVISSPNSQI